MENDIVFWGTLLATFLFLVLSCQYFWGIRKGINGNVQDAFLAMLFLALFSNYGYLWVARLLMYLDYDKFYFLLVRTKYVPPVYLTIAILIPLIIYKYKKLKGE